MMLKEEYEKQKRDDMEWAKRLIDKINRDERPYVKYKESRPVTDLKHMIKTSAQLYPDNVAFYQKPSHDKDYDTVTYKEALEDIEGLGTALLGLGLAGKRIAVIGDNCYEWAISYLAAVCGTGVVVPMDKELNELELKQLVIQAEVSCVIFAEKFEKMFTKMKERGDTVLEELVCFGAADDKGQVRELISLVREGKTEINEGNDSYVNAQIDSRAMSVLLFTSGTTGASKGVMLSHRNICADLMVSPTVLKVNDWDIFFSVLPLHHTYECTSGFLMPFYKGAAIAYCEGLKYITRNLAEIRPTMFLGVPAIFENLYKKIWKNIEKQGKGKLMHRMIAVNRKTSKIGMDLGNVFFKQIKAVFGGRMRLMICGGAAIDPNVLDGIQDFGITALQGYGLTECAPMGALNPDKAPKASSIGVPFPGCSMKIKDKDENGIGEICLKGDNVMLGYYNMPKATAQAVEDGWFNTGDLGYMDDEGYAYITGRKKNVIITKNGKNVFPEELEFRLNNADIIQESMVFGSNNEDGTDTLIVAAIRVDEEELTDRIGKDHTDEQTEKAVWEEVDKINDTEPFFKKIKKIVIKKDEFEKNTSKKIKRFVDANKQ